MEKTYAIYRGDRVRMICTGDSNIISLNRQGGEMMVEANNGESPDTHYVLQGQLVPRPHNPARLVNNKIRDIPARFQLFIRGQVFEGTDDSVELEFDQPGVYEITLQCWPYLDKEFEYEA